MAPGGEAAAAVTVTFTTSPVPAPNNQYSPRNVVAVWIQDSAGGFVKTIGRWSQVRTQHLVDWRARAGAADADAVSGATRQSHATPLTVTWNLRDRLGNVVPDGTYTIRLELAEANSNTVAQNNQGTFTFVKSAAPQAQTALTNGRFTNVSIDFGPDAGGCNDGVVDAPETCDPALAGSCPTSCPPSADACVPVELVGTPVDCSAACVAGTPIGACISGDGCCPTACDEAADSDCAAGDNPNTPGTDASDLSGGCTAGGGGGEALGFLLFGLLALTRRGTGST